jgi:hypothetical protein
MFQRIFSIYLVLVSSYFTIGQINTNAEESTPKEDSATTDKQSSTLYVSGQYFNAFRVVEDLTFDQAFDSLNAEQPAATGGIEVGTHINFSERVWLSVGVNFFGGGESWLYADSLTDSTFSYTNKYRQIALPLRLNYGVGDQLKWFGFIGVIPSSILGRTYQSKFTNANGVLSENDIEVIETNINSFQFIGTCGTGISYSFGTTTIFGNIEYRHHFSNTYSGIFLNHYQRLLGGNIGLSFTL